MESREYTSKDMHEMVTNILHHSDDVRLINNILEALDDRDYKGIFQGFEDDIISFNENFKGLTFSK